MRVGPGCASGKNLWRGMSYISEIRLQTVDDAQENASWYGEGASARRIYAYVGNDPLNKTDPLGLCAQTGCGNADPSNQLISTAITPATTSATAAVASGTTSVAGVTSPTSFEGPVQLVTLQQPAGSTTQSGQQNGSPSSQSGEQLAYNPTLWCAGPNSMCAIGRGKGLTSDTPGVLIDRDYPGEFQLCQTCFRLKFGKPLPEDYP